MIESFKSNLSNLSWENVYSGSDTDTAFFNFWDDWSTIFNLHFPVKYVALNKNYHKLNDFMSSGLLVSRKMKLELHHKCKISRNYEDASKYKNLRNLYNKVFKSAKKLYFESKLEFNKNDPKKLWATLNEILNRSLSKSSIDKVSVNGKSINDAQNMENEFNSFFSQKLLKIS